MDRNNNRLIGGIEEEKEDHLTESGQEGDYYQDITNQAIGIESQDTRNK